MHHNPRVVDHLVLEEAGGCQLRLALDDADALGELRQEEPLLERRVSATDDQKLVGAAVEGAVTRGAEVDAGADEVVLAGNPEASIGRSGGDERRVRLDLLAARQAQADVARPGAVRGDRLDAHGTEELHLVAPGLSDEAFGEISTTDALWKSGVVVDPLGDTGLATEPAALDHDGIDAFSRGIDRGGEPGRTAADDREVVATALGLEGQPELARQLLVGRVDEHFRAAEDDRWNRAPALLQFLDVLQAGGILVDVDPVIRDPLFRQKSLCAFAVGAPRRAVDGDLGHQVSRVRSELSPERVPRKRSTMLPLASMMITTGGAGTLYSDAMTSLASVTLG